MSKVTVAANSAPKLDEQLQALAKIWEEEGKWWIDLKYSDQLMWCFENRVAITALHSSECETSIFQMECIGCQRRYKHCMFSKRERKSDYPVSLILQGLLIVSKF